MSKRKSCPKPSALGFTRREIERTVQRVATEYGWLFGAAHDRTVGDDVKVRSHAADPTGGLVASDHKRQARDTLTDCHELMQDALASLRQAEARLVKALDHFDPRETPIPLRFPRTASQADLDEARDAKRRRRDSGEEVPA